MVDAMLPLVASALKTDWLYAGPFMLLILNPYSLLLALFELILGTIAIL